MCVISLLVPLIEILTNFIFLRRACKITYTNWYDGREPLPIRMELLNEKSEVKEDISVQNKKAVIVRSNGGSLPALMERKMGFFGKYLYYVAFIC